MMTPDSVMRTTPTRAHSVMKRRVALLLTATLAAGQGSWLQAGGPLETFDITGNRPSSIPGQVLGRLVGIKWDTRAIPVKYSMNTTLDPIPNPLGAPVLTAAQAQVALQASFDQWNTIPTSFIDMRITSTTANPGLRGFDMINELTFRTPAGFGAIASSPSTNFIVDVTLVNGDDIDGDGDSDVSNTIAVTTDVDSDGDLEFPAGFYKAGTILDNDVQFNTSAANGLRFTVGDAALDTVTRSVDLNTVATHEFGHSHGLSHSMDNQSSASDGDGATMFPFIDTGDPAAEQQQRSLHSDDIAWSSYFYPEGTAASGPPALQSGDVRFSKVYGLIKGTVTHGVLNQPILGASVYAIDQQGDRVVSSGFSGTTDLSVNPTTNQLFITTPEENIVDGKFVIPVPKGSYAVGVEALDGQPAAAGNISLTAQVGAAFGQMDFNEEFFGVFEDDVEFRPGQAKNVHVSPGSTRSGVHIVTGRTFNVSNFGNRNFIGFTGVVPGLYYAVRVPAAQIAAINPGEDILAHSIAFNTTVLDASVVPTFAEATLTTGVVNPDGTASIDLAHPLDRDVTFAAQENDFSQLFLKHPRLLGWRIRHGIANGSIQNLFLVLRVPTTTPFPGVSAAPPLIGLDGGVTPNDVPINGLSYQSTDGGATFTPVTTFNFMFSLILSEAPNVPWWWFWTW